MRAAAACGGRGVSSLARVTCIWPRASARRGLRLPRWAAIAKRVPATVAEPRDAFFSLTFPGEMNPYVLVGKKSY